MSVPVEFDLTADVSKEVIAGKGTASISIYGEEQKVAPEVYVDIKNKKAYAKTLEEEGWTSSDLDLDVDAEEVKAYPLSDQVENCIQRILSRGFDPRDFYALKLVL